MIEIQLTSIQFAELQIDNLVSKDKPYIESWSAGDIGSFNAIVNAVDYDNEFTFDMRGWSRQRVKSGTGAMIEVNEMNADQLYHLLFERAAEWCGKGFGRSVVKANEFVKQHGVKEAKIICDRYSNYTHVTDDARMIISEKAYVEFAPHFKSSLSDAVKICDLKRLVESHELVESLVHIYKSIDVVKEKASYCGCSECKSRLQAIFDVESCR